MEDVFFVRAPYGGNVYYRSSPPCVFASFSGLLPLIVFILSHVAGARALQVIGGNVTVVQQGTAILPCKLIDTTEPLTQISWQRSTRAKPQPGNFFTILPSGPHFVNGHDQRFQFIGNFNEKNGSLRLSDVKLLDEGVYTCIFTLFPSGNFKTEIPLNLLVPPVTHVKDNQIILGNEEVPFASCTASGSRPPAEVSWALGTLAEKVRAATNSTPHANGTTTTVSWLFGVPTREINKHLVECVVTSPALSKEEKIPITIQVYYPPTEVRFVQSKDSFQCVTEANPNASFTWIRSGKPWPESAVTEGATLQFLSMSSNLNGLYECKASNIYGKDCGYLYVHVTSGNCTACWVLFGILLSLILIAAAWKLYKSGKFTRTQSTPGERQKVPTTPSEPEGANEVEEDEAEDEIK